MTKVNEMALDVAFDRLAAVDASGYLSRDDLNAVIETYLEKEAEINRDGIHPPGTVASVRVRPRRFGDNIVWRSILVKTLSRSRTAAGIVEAFEVTFTGGSPSSVAGSEISFARMPPGLIGSRDTTVKNLVKQVLPAGGWDIDMTLDPLERRPQCGDRELQSFIPIAEHAFETTWRVVTYTPHTD